MEAHRFGEECKWGEVPHFFLRNEFKNASSAVVESYHSFVVSRKHGDVLLEYEPPTPLCSKLPKHPPVNNKKISSNEKSHGA